MAPLGHQILPKKFKTKKICLIRTAHLVSYTFFTRDVDRYKNASLLRLYQPPRTPFSQDTYH